MKFDLKLLVTLFSLPFPFFIVGAKPVSLFNGKDLTGWKGGNYVVEDGAIVCKGANLVTENEYTNYVFEFEFLLPPGGNNGLGIHYPGSGGPSGAGMELQILDNKHPKYAKLIDSQYHGSLYKLKAAKRGHLKPAGEWNDVEVVCNGRQVQVTLNGKQIIDTNLDDHGDLKDRLHQGYIGVQNHRTGVAFKNIRLKEL